MTKRKTVKTEEKPEEKAPETATPETETEETTGSIPTEVAETFKKLPGVTAAFISGEKWFFDERLARKHFEDYRTVANPYTQK